MSHFNPHLAPAVRLSTFLLLILVSQVEALGEDPIRRSHRRLKEAQKAAEKLSVEELVGQLGNEEFYVREPATMELIARGKPAAIPVLEATWSPDAEVSFRACYVLNALRKHYPYPDNDAAIDGFEVVACNPRFWQGQNPVLKRPDKSLDCDIKITSRHPFAKLETPIAIKAGVGDDQSEIQDLVWPKNRYKANGKSASAVAYMTLPGPSATKVVVNAELRATVYPVEFIAVKDLAPKDGKVVIRKDCTWIEQLKCERRQDGYEIAFRLNDLSGRINRDAFVSVSDDKGEECKTSVGYSGRSHFSANFTCKVETHGKPAAMTILLASYTPREVRAPVTFTVSVPDKNRP